MPNTREKLMRLLCAANSKATEAEAFEDATYAEQLGIQADHLIANGVTVANQVASSSKQLASSEWILVKDRLPEKNGEHILVCYDDGWVCDQYTPVDGGVTHWMPLPQPPGGE